MRNLYTLLIFSSFISTILWADIDCPPDSAVHVDTRTMLPDGSPNPTYGQDITTGLCGCLGFMNGASVDGDEVTFTIRIVDNEPIRGIELDIYHDSSILTYDGVDKGDKLDDVADEDGNPRTMTLLGNYLEDHVKVLAYSTSRARTAGDGVEGDLVHVTYTLNDGETLPDEVTFYLGLANLPGTSMDPELLNVVCGYPDESNPVVVSTEALAIDDNSTIPEQYALHQNYPNPFNPSTQIQYALPKESRVVISIYDLTGRKVRTLVNGIQSAGYRTVSWNATNEMGRPVSAGMYIYSIQAGDFIQNRKMVLMK